MLVSWKKEGSEVGVGVLQSGRGEVGCSIMRTRPAACQHLSYFPVHPCPSQCILIASHHQLLSFLWPCFPWWWGLAPPRPLRPISVPGHLPHSPVHTSQSTPLPISKHPHIIPALPTTSSPHSSGPPPLGGVLGDVRVMLHPYLTAAPLPQLPSLLSFFQLTNMCLSLCFPAASLGTGACAEWTRLRCGGAAPCGSHPAVRSVAWRLGGLGIASCCISCCLSCALHAAYLPSHSG